MLRWLRHISGSAAGLFATAGPVFTKELRISSRRRRNFALRGVYLVILILYMVAVWLTVVREDANQAAVFSLSRMSEAGKNIISCVVWFQFISSQLVAVIIMSSSISGEVHHRTFSALMTAPMSDFQMLVGKLAGGLSQLLVLLAVSLPLLVLVRVFGGVPWDYVICGVMVSIAATIFSGAVTLFYSILFRKPYATILVSLGTLAVVYVLLPLKVIGIVALLAVASGKLACLAMHCSPAAMMVMSQMSLDPAQAGSVLVFWPLHMGFMLVMTWLVLKWSARLVRKVALPRALGGGSTLTTAGPGGAYLTGFYSALPLPVATSAPGVARLTVPGLPRRRPGEPGQPPPIPLAAAVVVVARPAAPSLTEKAFPDLIPAATPTEAQFSPAGPADQLAAVLAQAAQAARQPPPAEQIIDLVQAPTVDAIPPVQMLPMAIPAGRPPAAVEDAAPMDPQIDGCPILWKELRGRLLADRDTRTLVIVISSVVLFLAFCLCGMITAFGAHETQAGFSAVYLAVALIVPMVLASTCLTSEKETGSWPILLTTPLDDRQILIAKLRGLVRRSWPAWTPLAAHMVLYTLFFVLNPISLLCTAVVGLSAGFFLVGSGVYFSARYKRTTSAVAANLAVAVGLWGILPAIQGLVLEIVGVHDQLLYQVNNILLLFNPLVQTFQLGTFSLDKLAESSNGQWGTLFLMTLISSLAYCLAGWGFILLAVRRFRRDIF